MKKLLLALMLAAAGVNAANAQIYKPAVVNGTILGGIAGAIIGGHNHDRWGEGAIIGAAAGALLGATVPAPNTVIYEQPPVTVVQAATTVPVAATVPMAATVANAPVVAVPTTAAPVVVAQPTQVVYVPYYAPAPVVYESYPIYPVVRVGIGYGYGWAPRHAGFVRHGYRRW